MNTWPGEKQGNPVADTRSCYYFEEDEMGFERKEASGSKIFTSFLSFSLPLLRTDFLLDVA